MRKWLLDIRKKQNLTQAQVAEQSEIARTTYSMIELGERGVTVENAKKISCVLGFHWTLFFEDKIHEMHQKEKQEVI
ncbi:helix-turn-helix transcriptional regulator [Salinibacillus aidingensis]|uniref:Helix-turn-helix transcriptional regulator n=1 Tax=Salinibacillus aidingensis TaxID=237684 RepID=A0ABN1B6Y7_9BACI